MIDIKKLRDMCSLYGPQIAEPVNAVLDELEATRNELEQERVRLAGCGVAALGYAYGSNDTKPGDYGHSASFDDVKNLHAEKEKCRKELETARAEIEKLKKNGEVDRFFAKSLLEDQAKQIEDLKHDLMIQTHNASVFHSQAHETRRRG